MKVGIWELLIILAIALLIFGPKALPKLGESIGKTIGSFKKGLNEDEAAENKASATADNAGDDADKGA